MVAVALFGAVVTTILSAQAGLVAGNQTAANMSQAVALGRCRMSEVEEKQLKLGFPEIRRKGQQPGLLRRQGSTGFFVRLAGRACDAARNHRARCGRRCRLGSRWRPRARRRAIGSGLSSSFGGGVGSLLNPAGGGAARLRRGPSEHRSVAAAIVRRGGRVRPSFDGVCARVPLAQALLEARYGESRSSCTGGRASPSATFR